MKNLFRKRVCGSCGSHYDPILKECPFCHALNEDFSLKHHGQKLFWLDPLKQISIFLLVVLGTNILAIVLYPLFLSLDKITSSLIVNSLVYVVILACISILIFPKRKELIRCLKDYKSYLWGFVFFFVLVGASISLSSLAQSIFNLLYPNSDIINNTNQSSIELMAKRFPVPSIIIFGLIGPIVEELGYRVGLFNLLKRFNNIIAYAITAIIFGFIHFNFLAPIGPELTYELLIISNYIVGGIILCIVYDNFGLPASMTAHVLNNVLSLLLTTLVVQ